MATRMGRVGVPLSLLWVFGKPYMTPGADPVGESVLKVSVVMILSFCSVRRKLFSLSSALVTAFCGSSVDFLNLVVSFKMFSTLVLYSSLSSTTVPLPLSGRVTVMEVSVLRSLSAFICEGGSFGIVCLCSLNSR